MSILYDYPTLENEDDENLQGIHAFIRRVSEASTPGSYLVEMFPWMIHIPERYDSESLPFLFVYSLGTMGHQICKVET